MSSLAHLVRLTHLTRLARWGFALLLLPALAIALGCADERQESESESLERDFSAPAGLQAVLVLEPDRLELGQVITAEVTVVTPPDHWVLPIPMTKLPGLWLLGARALPPEVTEQRWIHRTHFRVRPRLTGEHTWPSIEVTVEGPDGAQQTLEIESRTFEVTSVRPSFGVREQPFGTQQLETPEAATGGFGPGFATGFALAAALAALWLWLARRYARRALEPEPTPASEIDLYAWSQQELSEALALLERDPSRAASIGAHLLRAYLARRFDSPTRAATTEELERRTPALAEHRLWPDFVRLLHLFDDVRFRPRSADSKARPEIVEQRVRAALEGARNLVESSLPPGSRPGKG